MNALSQLSPRAVFLATFAACVGLLGYGLFLQEYKGLVPCQLCILQRYAFIAVALVALLAGLSNPRGFAAKFWGGLMSIMALAGGSVSVRQSWLQHNPPEVTACGPDLDYMVSRFPLSDVLPKLFRGEGDCSKVDWSFLGLSMAEWALVCFVLIFAAGVWQILRRRRS